MNNRPRPAAFMPVKAARNYQVRVSLFRIACRCRTGHSGGRRPPLSHAEPRWWAWHVSVPHALGPRRPRKEAKPSHAALELYTELAGCRNLHRMSALVELAKHYEHRERNYAMALE